MIKYQNKIELLNFYKPVRMCHISVTHERQR